MSERLQVLKGFEDNRDFMESTVKDGIERNRKGNASVVVKDSCGTPIKDAAVCVEQISHDFRFGANIFMLDEFECEAKNEQYKRSFKELFNLATVPFYWRDLEPEEGKPRYAADSPKIYRRPAPDLCIDYCLKNGIEPKLHCLNYDNFTPTWLQDAEVEHHKKMLEKHIKELAERYSDIIPQWEVTNETFKNYLQYYQTKFYKEDDFVEWTFRTADKYLPNNHLIINDYYVFDRRQFRENRSPYYMQIERLFRNGVYHLDSIGMQFHSFFPQEKEEENAPFRYDPLHLYRVMDLYARFGKKLQITEMTIPAYSPNDEDEEVQAELIRNLYAVFFSHPAMEAVIYWNLVDGYAHAAPQGDMTVGENKYYGGLLRFDMTPKPAYNAIKELLQKTWHTDAILHTNELGAASFRGFYGNYRISVTHNGKTITKEMPLSKGNTDTFEITV